MIEPEEKSETDEPTEEDILWAEEHEEEIEDNS